MNVSVKTESIEIRGVSKEEIESYFLESGWKNTSPGVWSFDRGQVVIGDPGEIFLGSIRLPSVTLVFRLQKSVFEDILTGFRSRFLKAGG